MISSINVPNFQPIQPESNGISAAAAHKEVEFSYNPQDGFVMSPTTTTLKDVTIDKHGPSTSRVKLNGENLAPNKDGNFVFDPKDAKKYTAAASLATVAKTLATFEDAMGSKINWAAGKERIDLNPDGGVDLNAFYSRSDNSLNFFHQDVHGTRYMTGASGEVVSHEVGHAILDAIRPGYLTSWQADTNGFHEAFADTTAMLMATQDDGVCELVAQQTGGDMSKPNCLGAVGEELGKAINEMVGRDVTGGDFIRNTQNDFKWQAPHTVPKNPSGIDPLTTEMHSWSRIWSGAQYDLLSAMVENKMAGGMTQAEAIKSAGKECLDLYSKTLQLAPKTNCTYRQMAQCMLKADAQLGGNNHQFIVDSFTNRNILFEGDDQPDMMAMSVPDNPVPQNVTVTLGDDCGMFAGAEVSGVIERDPNVMYATDAGTELSQDIKLLIDQGSILYTEPGQHLSLADKFDKNGNPYIGIVTWTEGKMVIERNTMVS
ncbi:MAG: hypothetical protein Q4F00_01935 [bacterium]|nr:hypothetical protein [bacterium]